MLPLAVIVFYSFRNTSGPVFKPGFGLESYRQIFYDVAKTVINSFVYSFIAVVLIAVVGTLIGFIIARKRNLAVKVLDPLLMIPYIVPGTVLGIGFIVAFNRKPIYLAGTATIIILTYFIRRLPYSVRSAASILKQIDPALEEAASTWLVPRPHLQDHYAPTDEIGNYFRSYNELGHIDE